MSTTLEENAKAAMAKSTAEPTGKTQKQITDTIPTVGNKTFLEAIKDPFGFNRITGKFQRRFSIWGKSGTGFKEST